MTDLMTDTRKDHVREMKLLDLTAGITVAAIAANQMRGMQIDDLIGSVHAGLVALSIENVTVAPEPELVPAVAVRASVKPDYIVCLEDGRKLKMLKRHLMSRYSLTPEQYRAKWKLPADYPMVAPNYADQRRTLAKKIGLGKKPAATLATAS